LPAAEARVSAPDPIERHSRFVEPIRVVWSLLGAVALNLILAVNHKPGRYVAQ
jgi:hypothetical protein